MEHEERGGEAYRSGELNSLWEEAADRGLHPPTGGRLSEKWDQGEFYQSDGVPSTLDCRFESKESPGQAKMAGHPREKLPSSGERSASFRRPESKSCKDPTPPPTLAGVHGGAEALTEIIRKLAIDLSTRRQ